MRSGHATRRKIRILIADREGVFRLGLKRLFGLEDDLRVVGEAEDGKHAIALSKSLKPDLLLVQAELVAEAPHGFWTQMQHASPSSKIIINASALAEDEALHYVKNGASGVILKSVDPPLFVKCLRKVMDNEVWLPKQQIAKMAKLLEISSRRPSRPVDTLTRREKVIISYLMEGWRNREIGRHLSITEQTVKNHLRTIYDKVGVSDRLELVLYAIHQRLDLPPVEPVATPG